MPNRKPKRKPLSSLISLGVPAGELLPIPLLDRIEAPASNQSSPLCPQAAPAHRIKSTGNSFLMLRFQLNDTFRIQYGTAGNGNAVSAMAAP